MLLHRNEWQGRGNSPGITRPLRPGWRRGRDLNPRPRVSPGQLLSRQPCSTAPAPLRAKDVRCRVDRSGNIPKHGPSCPAFIGSAATRGVPSRPGVPAVPHRLTASWLGKTRPPSGIPGIFFPGVPSQGTPRRAFQATQPRGGQPIFINAALYPGTGLVLAGPEMP
jgi:hypothetical protein